MPHFENIDKYEATNPKSGRKEIIPIAPHSLQAADYRPRKREGEPLPGKKKAAEFPEVNVEPISVTQMEKEFKMAARREGRSGHRGKSLWSRLSKWLSGLFKSTGKKEKPQQSRGMRNRPPRGRKPSDQKKSGQEQAREGNQTEGGSGNRNRRRRRPRGRGKGQQPGNQQGGRQQPGNQQGGRQQQGQKQEGRKGNRNRRNRRRPSKGGNQNSNDNP